MTDTAKIIYQLGALLLLTRTEQQIARVRLAQARTDAVRRKLTQNAGHAAERAQAITEQLRALGGVPDVVSPAVGRLAAVLKATVEQAAPIGEALLQDLQLEHQLLDRATHLKVLAEQAELPQVRRLAERLIGAHRATVRWLTVVLAEQALGGPAALQPTPAQRVAGGTAGAALAPYRFWARRINEALARAQRRRERAGDQLRQVADKAGSLTGAVPRRSRSATRRACAAPSGSPAAKATGRPPTRPRPPARSSAPSPPRSCRSRATTACR